MCGITGFNWNDPELIQKMTTVITHRGPDQEGTWSAEGISLGHRRLSIIDLSEDGRQPMCNEDGSVQLAFNGEIYNFKELRSELTAKGHIFKSESDSEVIVHAYEEYGMECLDKLQGMFAFAIWDTKRRRLLLARDRIGIKPLYYYQKDDKLIFASEIKAILEHPDVPRKVNQQALYDYLGFEFVPAPETMFASIRKLKAGEYLLYEKGEARVSTWWDMTFRPTLTEPRERVVEEERDLLDRSVKSHLVSDVPLGVFLSGGLDSSALVAMMRKHISGRIQTFTIGYKDKSFSEVEYAEQVAKYLDTDHKVLTIETMDQASVEKSLWHLDEPMTDLSAIPLMFVCEEARKHVTVCLSGEGGDESFAGYDRFKASKLDRMYSIIPGPLRKSIISPLVGKLPDQAQKKGAINMLKRFIEGSDLPKEAEHLRWQYFSNADQDAALYQSGFKSAVNMDPFYRIRETMKTCDAQDIVNREIYLDMRFMMTDSVLMKVDKMSMANSLEVRVPLLDHEFIEYIARIRGDWKLQGTETKAILRSALDGMLPPNIVRRGKQGYSLPVKQLLRDDLKDYMIGLLNESSIIKHTMNMDYVNTLIQDHLDMKRNNNHILWALMNVAIWQNRFNVTI